IHPQVYNFRLPILRISYPIQLTTKLLPPKLHPPNQPQYPKPIINPNTHHLFFPLPQQQNLSINHSHKLIQIPQRFQLIPHTPTTNYPPIEHKSPRIYPVQFHPQLPHTQYPNHLLPNFLPPLCHSTPECSIQNFVQVQIEKIP
ncbi:glutamine amidotransferase-related protein, partial [Staphylococcus saprophyticus]